MEKKCILDVYDVRPYQTRSGREVEARVGRETMLGCSVQDILKKVYQTYGDVLCCPTKALRIALQKNPWLVEGSKRPEYIGETV